ALNSCEPESSFRCLPDLVNLVGNEPMGFWWAVERCAVHRAHIPDRGLVIWITCARRRHSIQPYSPPTAASQSRTALVTPTRLSGSILSQARGSAMAINSAQRPVPSMGIRQAVQRVSGARVNAAAPGRATQAAIARAPRSLRFQGQ